MFILKYKFNLRAIGALYGRLIGQLINDFFQIPEDSKEWDWIDPGVLALLGAASFLSGTSRLIMLIEYKFWFVRYCKSM